MNNYKLIYNKTAYDLPTYNFSILKKMMEIDNQNEDTITDVIDKYKTMYNFIQSLLKEDDFNDLFENKNFEDIDPSKITIAYLGVVLAYEKPVNDFKVNATKKDIDNLEILDKIEGIAKMVDKIDKMK